MRQLVGRAGRLLRARVYYKRKYCQIIEQRNKNDPIKLNKKQKLSENFKHMPNNKRTKKTADVDGFQHQIMILNKNSYNFNENNTYSCDHCWKAFNEKFKLITHIVSHSITEQSKTIEITENRDDEVFCSKCNSKLRMIDHGIEPSSSKITYEPCTKCNFKTSEDCDLQKRVPHHNNLKVLHGNECNSRFSTKSSLNAHLRSQSRKKLHKCDECGSSFSRTQNLRVHMRTHNGERPYECTKCDSKFKQMSHLLNHEKIHTGEKPYTCPVCDSKFTKKYTLQIHMRVHTGEKPYECETCGSKFSQRSSWLYHILHKHNK